MDELYDDAGPEQYSDQSREALRQRADELIEGLRSHTEALLALRGGSAELPGLFDRQDELETLVRSWNDAVLDHTGTTALVLDDPDDEDDGEDEPEQVLETDVISIVSRIDLSLDDPDELLREGRAAYSRLWPDETEEDIAVAVPDAGQALYALTHESGSSSPAPASPPRSGPTSSPSRRTNRRPSPRTTTTRTRCSTWSPCRAGR